jgi:esterase
VFLNEFADTLAPVDMTASAEFASLLQSAADLGVPHDPGARYLSRQTVVQGLRFHFLEWGSPEAPPIVLLHGGNQSAHSWDLVSLHLSDRYRVFAVDQRGHGDSEWSREIDYSPATRAADILALIADQGLDRPAVIGHSMGGIVAMRMAVSGHLTTRGMVLVDVGPELSPTGVQVVHDFVLHNVEFDSVEQFVDRVANYDRFRSREHIARTVKYNMMCRADGRYVSKVDHRRLSGPADSPVGLDECRRVQCPVLVVRGAQSDVLEADAAERFVAVLPRGELVTVANAGHNVHGANTPGFLEAVGPYLASLA